MGDVLYGKNITVQNVKGIPLWTATSTHTLGNLVIISSDNIVQNK